MGDVDDEDPEEQVAYIPEGFAKEIWGLDAFENAVHEEGLSRDGLVALEVLKDEIAKVRRLHMTTRLTGDEYIEKMVLLTGVLPDAAEAELEKRRATRDDLLRTVLGTMESRQAEARGAFPLPYGLTTETIALPSFLQACRFLGVAPATLARPEVTAVELTRLAKMEAEARCSGAVYMSKLAALLGDEFNPKADQLEERARLKTVEAAVMKERREMQAGSISWIKEAMGRIEAQEDKERRVQEGGEAARARFLVDMTARIDQGIARERLKAEQVTNLLA